MKKRFVKDLALYAPSQFLPALTAFITTPILTRLLAPAEYGHWALASTVAGLLVALAASGMGSAALRFYPGYETRSALDVFFATFGVSLAAIVAAFTGVSLLAFHLLRQALPPWLTPLLPLVILIFVGSSIQTVFLAVVRAQGRSGAFTIVQLLTSYGSLGAGLLLVLAAGMRVEGLLLGTLLTFVAVVPFLLVLAGRDVGFHPSRFQLRDALSIWEYAWPLTLGNAAMWVLRVSDLFIISAFWPARDVGLYTVSYSISARSVDLLASLFLLGVSPLVYKTWETEGREATETTLSMVTRIYLILCLPAAVGLSVLAFPFVALLTTPEYYEGARIVDLVVFSSFVLGLANIAMLGLAIRQRARRLGGLQILAASIHVALQLILIPRYGYVAAAVSTLVAYTALLLLQAAAARPYLAWRFPFQTLRNVTVASALMGLVVWGIYGMSGAGRGASPAFLLLSIVVAVPVYGACLWWLGEVDEPEKRAVLSLWARVAGR